MQTISKAKLIKNSESFSSVILCAIITIIFIGLIPLAIVKSADRITAVMSTLILTISVCLTIFIGMGPLRIMFKLMRGQYRTSFANVCSIKRPFPPCAGSGTKVLEIDGGFTIGISDALAQRLRVGDEIAIVFVEGRDYPAVIAKKDSLFRTEAS